MTTLLFRGNTRLLIRALPYAAVIVLLKLIIDSTSWTELELSPLLTAAVSAEVFIVGFMLAGTTGDFKEAERLPGEIAASLETMADECLIAWRGHPARRGAHVSRAAARDRPVDPDPGCWPGPRLDDVMADLRALNEPVPGDGAEIQAGFTTRLKGEQHNVRRLVLRMDTMRRTSYVAAGYLIAEVDRPAS